jgi:hypothetical protein
MHFGISDTSCLTRSLSNAAIQASNSMQHWHSISFCKRLTLQQPHLHLCKFVRVHYEVWIIYYGIKTWKYFQKGYIKDEVWILSK